MVTSYANLGGSGDRVGVVGIQVSAGLRYWRPGPPTKLLDGSTSGGGGTFWFPAGATVSGAFLLFDFGTAVLIDEAKWYQDTADTHGSWKWQGSNDNSSWTDIGSSFTLGGATTQTQTQLNGNAASYRYYRLLGVSGVTNDIPYTTEIEFKIDGMADPTPETSYANTGGTGDRRASITMTNSGIITGSPPYNNWIDGNTSENDDYFNSDSLSGSDYVRWQFAESKVINQIRFYQETLDFHGFWKVQGSNDASSWTDIGHQFQLGGELMQIITAPHGNATGYLYYQIVGVSGSTSDVPYIREVEFKIGDPAGGGGGGANSGFFSFFRKRRDFIGWRRPQPGRLILTAQN